MERPQRWSVWLLWVVLALPALTADAIGLNEPRPAWQQAVGVGVLAVAVASNRRYPLLGFGLTAVLGLLTAPALFSVSYGIALGVLALLLGLRAARVLPAVLLLIAVGCAGTVKIALVGVDPAPEWVVLTSTLLFVCVFPWLGGRHWRQSRELAVAGWARAARLEDEQRTAEERARLRERSRIAQDMHDSLGHELSLIALRAGALQVAPDLPDQHRAAVADLRAAAADATDRLHRIIGVLREDDDPVPLTPAGESIGQLVAHAAESGLPVRWEPADSATAVQRGGVAEAVLHRVVREALTNVARHAPGAPVTVTATEEPGGVTVTVTNGRSTQASSPSSGGSGLVGLRAAVTANGGAFEAGPHGDGFRVRAYVPDQPTAAALPVTAPSASPAPPAGSAPPVHEAATPASVHSVHSAHRHPARLAPAAHLADSAAPHPHPHPARPASAAHSASFTLARRRVAVAAGAGACAGVALIGGAFGWYAYTETHSVLDPTAYPKLRLGDSADEITPLLPDRTVRDPPVERAPAPPRGAVCRYYRASGELLVSVDHFRLCFDGEGRLTAKDVIPGADRSRDEQEEFLR
jgi:signal transduction histidine kinase